MDVLLRERAFFVMEGDTMLHALWVLKLLALQNGFKREVSERRPELVILPIKNAKVGLYRQGLGKKVPVPAQN
jgi:hypothetical protein